MRRIALLLALVLAWAPAEAAAPTNWRQLVAIKDGKRLEHWHAAWTTGLREARAGGAGAAIADDPALFDPDRAFADQPAPPAGDYRCRHLDIGARPGAPSLVADAWGRCRIEGGDDGRWLVTGLDGVQRVSGTIYTDTDRRAVFLGTIAFAEERRPAAYGHAAGRDMAGVVERIGEGRWRLALPFPPLGGALALVEFSAR